MISVLTLLWLTSAASLENLDSAVTAETQRDLTDALATCEASLQSLPFSVNTCVALLDPDNVEVWHSEVHERLAVAYARQQQLDEAEHHIAQALLLRPDHWQTLANAGFVYLYQNRFRQAHQAFTDAMNSNPDFPLFLLRNRALAAQGLGRFTDAAEDLALYAQYANQPQDECAITDFDCTRDAVVGPHPIQ